MNKPSFVTTYATIDIEAFIVPNTACTADKFIFGGEKKAARAAEICELNNIPYNEETDKLVQLWCVGGNSDNMQDHGFSYTENNLQYNFRFDSVLPATIFEGHVEGDVVSVKIPLEPNRIYELGEGEDYPRGRRTIYMDDDNDIPQFEITFNIKLNQTSYRYRRFGNFEDVLKTVCR